MQKHSREPSSLAAIGRRGTAAYTMRAHTEASAGFLCLPHDPRTQLTTTYTSLINSNTASSTRTQAIYTILPPPPLPAQRPDRQAVSRHRILSASPQLWAGQWRDTRNSGNGRGGEADPLETLHCAIPETLSQGDCLKSSHEKIHQCASPKRDVRLSTTKEDSEDRDESHIEVSLQTLQ
jgi:hypothetical protein